MKDTQEKLLKEYENRKCPSCNINIEMKIVQKQVIGICKNNDCKKIWIFYKDKSGKENYIEALEVSGLIEFYVELPFNLGIPTGLYAFDKPNQIMLRRDMYHFQKGNELENFQTFQPIYAPQDKVFNEHGLIKEEFEEYKFKRKMKSVLFKRYPMTSLINKKITIEQLIEKGFFNSYIYKTQNQFFQDVNEFLTYYSLYFPSNDINIMYQHEIRPISIYEFSKCIFNSHLIINQQYYPFIPIIQDVTNLKGIPDITYLSNKGKMEEFDKILQNRKNNPVYPHQELLFLARSLYRTNKIHMGASVITISITAIESLIHKLEDNHPEFQNLKKLKKKWESDLNNKNLKLSKYKNKSGRKYFGFLEFYTNIQPLLAKIIKRNYPNNSLSIKMILNYLKNLNIARWIRNDITHRAKFEREIEFSYENETGFTEKYLITYKNKIIGQNKTIKFSDLWQSILKTYNYLDKILLETIYPQINWDLKSIYKNELAARSTKTGKGIIQVLMNLDWRETNSYNIKLSKFAVPPERFPIGVETTDGKCINMNINYEKGRYEFAGKGEENDDGSFSYNLMSFPLDLSYEEVQKHIKNKTLNFYIDGNANYYNYRSCEKCGYIIPIHHHLLYFNNECPNPECKYSFSFKDYWYVKGRLLLEQQKYQEALKCYNNAISIDPSFQEALNDIGVCFDNLDLLNEALEIFDKIIEINPLNKLAFYNKGAVFIKLKQFDKTNTIIDKLLELDANYARAYFLRACLKSVQNEKLEAIKELKLALNLNKNLLSDAKKDPDLENIRESKEFKDLISNFK
jgi:tetratricopeptide (TPR) repeat protein